MEFIGREKATTYLQCIYCKVKPQIQRELSHTIKSRCACVWMYMVDIYMMAKLILLCSLETYLSWNLETFAREQGLSYSSIFLFFFFSGGHLSTHCFKYLGHFYVHFFPQLFFSYSSFFMNNFCIAPCLFSATKLWEIAYKNLEH